MPTPEPAGAPGTQAQRVLHIESDPAAREALREILRFSPYEVAEAVGRPDLALPAYIELRPDYVLLDAGIGTKTGGTWSGGIVTRLKEEDPAARVVVTYEPDEGRLVLEALRLGAAEVLAKPFTTFRTMDCLVNARLASARLHSTRRRHGRLRASLAATWRVGGFGPFGGKREATRTTDLSLSGVGLVVKDPEVIAGETLKLAIALGHGRTLRCRGQVRHIASDHGRRKAGIAFLGLSERQTDLLERALLDLLTEGTE